MPNLLSESEEKELDRLLKLRGKSQETEEADAVRYNEREFQADCWDALCLEAVRLRVARDRGLVDDAYCFMRLCEVIERRAKASKRMQWDAFSIAFGV